MTNMKRVTVSIPDEVDKDIAELRKRSEFSNLSYSEIIRILVMRGLNKRSA